MLLAEALAIVSLIKWALSTNDSWKIWFDFGGVSFANDLEFPKWFVD